MPLSVLNFLDVTMRVKLWGEISFSLEEIFGDKRLKLSFFKKKKLSINSIFFF